jgi:hypothetical protein
MDVLYRQSRWPLWRCRDRHRSGQVAGLCAVMLNGRGPAADRRRRLWTSASAGPSYEASGLLRWEMRPRLMQAAAESGSSLIA